MFMRFRGGGVGYKSTRDATRCTYHDRDPMDTDGHHNAESDSDGEISEAESTTKSSESDSSGSDTSAGDSDLDAPPLDEYEQEGYAEF